MHYFFLFYFSFLRKQGLSNCPGLKDTLDEMYTRGIDSPYLLATLIDIYEEELENKKAEPRTLDKAVEVKEIAKILRLKSYELIIYQWHFYRISIHLLTPSGI